jgi:hypothetical protein
MTSRANGNVEITLTGPFHSLEFSILAAADGPRNADVSEVEFLSFVPVNQGKKGSLGELVEGRRKKNLLATNGDTPSATLPLHSLGPAANCGFVGTTFDTSLKKAAPGDTGAAFLSFYTHSALTVKPLDWS